MESFFPILIDFNFKFSLDASHLRVNNTTIRTMVIGYLYLRHFPKYFRIKTHLMLCIDLHITYTVHMIRVYINI